MPFSAAISSIILVTIIAVNIDMIIPTESVIAKPLIVPVPSQNSVAAAISVVTLASSIVVKARLKLVSIESLQGSPDYEQLLQNYFGDTPISDGGAIIKDETICIRCGLCAERCPVGAITMETFTFKEVWTNE